MRQQVDTVWYGDHRCMLSPGDLEVDQEVDQSMEEEEDSAVPDCGLEPGEELVEGPVGLRGVASAAALAGWGMA
jgi:hypothetical protein